MRKFNFSSGPSVLPEPVLRKAQVAVWDWDDTGIGILEHSHRGPEFTALCERAERLVREVGDVPDEYAILFLQGGASAQFHMVPMNFLAAGATADYCVTGTWGQKAIGEAKKLGQVHVACSSEASNFAAIPSADEVHWSSAPVYGHFTSNETIHGVQWAAPPPPPPGGAPLICDASSDLFSRPLEISRYGMVYAGAQKNLGPSGTVLALARKDLIERGSRALPTMLQYRTWASDHSLYNTPPTFGIYLVAEVLEWVRAEGGIAAMQARAVERASLVYDFLDQSRLFHGHARADSRSLMNITFRATTPALEAEFLAGADALGLANLKGHRSVGGMRASMYNAFPVAGARALVEYLDEFERAHR
ncbi:MAG: 3-phosphoserine/phosphohydroxythreonine transaminase [Deltaproteobacteria bacterium]|nr:3-phosphoserine/phosphohydroxythreonine transaminase [Deltaproteobacteria bacterium]